MWAHRHAIEVCSLVIVVALVLVCGLCALLTKASPALSSSLCPAPTSIPPILIQTYKRPIPPPMRAAMDTWPKHNPWLRTRFYDDEACVSFLRKFFPPRVLNAYAALRPPAFRADLFRYAALYVHGGFYADAPMVCNEPLPDMMRHAPAVAVLDDFPRAVYNAFLGLPPGHPVAARALLRAVANVEARKQPKTTSKMRCIDVTGPGCLWACIPWVSRAVRRDWVWGRHTQNNDKLGHGCVVFRRGGRGRRLRLSDVQSSQWRKGAKAQKPLITCKYAEYDEHRTATHHWFKHCLTKQVYLGEGPEAQDR